MPVSAQTPGRVAPHPSRVPLVTEREARAATAAIKEKFASMQTSWWGLGQTIREALDHQVPMVMGLSVVDWLRECVGESLSKVYRSLRIVKALDGLPETKVKLLTEGKAYQLTRLRRQIPNPEALQSSGWVERAVGMGNDDFERAVDEFLEKKTGVKTDPLKKIGVTVVESVSKLWNDAEAKVAEILEIDIELRPGLRGRVFEAVATLILNTDEEILRAEMKGIDGSEPPAPQRGGGVAK